ncbi:uncharacterized protein [Penaeus vannamei]
MDSLPRGLVDMAKGATQAPGVFLESSTSTSTGEPEGNDYERRLPNWVDFLVLGLYFAFVLAIGLYGKREKALRMSQNPPKRPLPSNHRKR